MSPRDVCTSFDVRAQRARLEAWLLAVALAEMRHSADWRFSRRGGSSGGSRGRARRVRPFEGSSMISSCSAQSGYSLASFTAPTYGSRRGRSSRFGNVLRSAASVLLYCALIRAGCQAGDTRARMDNQPAGSAAHLDSLPIWAVEIEVALGQREQRGHDFIAPSPIGTDQSGFHYVVDSSLREVRRFDSSGPTSKPWSEWDGLASLVSPDSARFATMDRDRFDVRTDRAGTGTGERRVDRPHR